MRRRGHDTPPTPTPGHGAPPDDALPPAVPASGPLLSTPIESTPLERDGGGPGPERDAVVPPALLWAMRAMKTHGRSHGDSLDGAERLQTLLGAGDATVAVIEDGDDHCMVARDLGSSPDGCRFVLVARLSRLDVEDVLAGWTEAAGLFALASGFTLCGVFQGDVSNVIEAADYRHLRDVPAEYLPPSPPLTFEPMS